MNFRDAQALLKRRRKNVCGAFFCNSGTTNHLAVSRKQKLISTGVKSRILVVSDVYTVKNKNPRILT